MKIIYFHRLHFPSASGQTIQVIRDYFSMAVHHEVHLFYRNDKKLSENELNNLLNEHNASLSSTFMLHHIRDGLLAKHTFRKLLHKLIDIDSTPAIIVTRTMDHTEYTVKAGRRRPYVRTILELHETAIPHMIYQQQGRPFRGALSKIQERRIFSAIDGIIATAPPQIELLNKLFSPHAPAVLLPNSYAPEYGKTASIVRKTPPWIIRYAGQFSSWKNTDILFETIKKLPRQFILELAGGKRNDGGKTKELIEKKSKEYRVTGRVFYRGFLPPKEVPKFLAEANILVLPLGGNNLQSRLFTSPMKLFEYAASGTPMIVTDQPTTRSMIDDGQEALFVTPDNAKDLAKAVIRLTEDRVLAQKLGQKAKKWVAKFSAANRVKRYNNFIETLFNEADT